MLLGLFVAQLSVAAFACPLLAPASDAPLPAVHAGCSRHAGPTRPDPAPANSALCELHCQSAVTVPPPPAPPVALVSGPPLTVTAFDAAAVVDPGRELRIERTAMATAPPATILYCRIQV